MRTILIQQNVDCGQDTCDSCSLLNRATGRCGLFNEYVEATPSLNKVIFYRLEKCTDAEQGR